MKFAKKNENKKFHFLFNIEIITLNDNITYN